MVFVTGNSCYVQSSLSYPLSLSSSSRSVLFYSFPRNAEAKRRSTVAMASTREEEDESSSEGIMSCQRRAFLFVAISVIPFFKLTARALDPRLLAIRKRVRALDGFPTISEFLIFCLVGFSFHHEFCLQRKRTLCLSL